MHLHGRSNEILACFLIAADNKVPGDIPGALASWDGGVHICIENTCAEEL